MNTAIKTKWVKALRSGKYEQGQASLRSKLNRFCCLGVLCDIIDDSKWKKPVQINNFSYLYGDNITSLPFLLLKEIDLDKGDQDNLILMNDGAWRDGLQGQGLTFKEIADYIEENL